MAALLLLLLAYLARAILHLENISPKVTAGATFDVAAPKIEKQVDEEDKKRKTLEVSILQHPPIIIINLCSSSSSSSSLAFCAAQEEMRRDCRGGDRGDPETTRPTPPPDSRGTLI
ncbi:hypothetical protein FQA47_020396 [Oryzias melastigma]|uniref:Uncharacterized protein n=1 Tax=Oryzias melastigma TaxID=30732 RepID=A0A834FLD9_ORYME|nr:hypothetical protein FQA47_020396 [Oryzias melastigma]